MKIADKYTTIMQAIPDLILVVTLTFGLLPAWGEAAQQTAGQPKVSVSIQGKITNRKGNPINGAIITTKPRTTQVVSRRDGSYVIPNVSAGSYWITAETRNKQIGRIQVHVVTSESNIVPGIQIRVREGGTLQEKWEQRRNAALTSLALFPIGTFAGLSIAGGDFADSANEAREQFDNSVLTSPRDFLARAELWEKSQKLHTREDWMRVTSLNLLVDALPFYWYSVKGKRISNPSLILYYGTQAVIFGTWAAIDWDRSRDAEELADAYATRIQFQESTRQQGKNGKLRERAKWLAINAALDVGIGYLYWKIIPQSVGEQQVSLQWEPQLDGNRVGLSISGTFR